MAERRRVSTFPMLVREISGALSNLDAPNDSLTLREKILQLVTLNHSIKNLGVSVAVSHGYHPSNAKNRIRQYLVDSVGLKIRGVELEVVSGISEYARRVRELRREEGLKIYSGASPDADSGINLAPDEYLLADTKPDIDAARRWLVANRIRNESGSTKSRLLRYLQENLGRVVTTNELSYVAKGSSEYARRIRELRTEEGFAIATRFTGRPELASGEYILLDADRVAEPHDRRIPIDAQREVYERDDNRCQVCGWSPTDWVQEDPRILELHHLQRHAKGGPNLAANLTLLCSKCHDDVHADRIVLS